jgi:hypothetical protein
MLSRPHFLCAVQRILARLAGGMASEDVRQCLEFVREWNTNAKTSFAAQAMLQAILQHHSPEVGPAGLLRGFCSVPGCAGGTEHRQGSVLLASLPMQGNILSPPAASAPHPKTATKPVGNLVPAGRPPPAGAAVGPRAARAAGGAGALHAAPLQPRRPPAALHLPGGLCAGGHERAHARGPRGALRFFWDNTFQFEGGWKAGGEEFQVVVLAQSWHGPHACACWTFTCVWELVCTCILLLANRGQQGLGGMPVWPGLACKMEGRRGGEPDERMAASAPACRQRKAMAMMSGGAGMGR